MDIYFPRTQFEDTVSSSSSSSPPVQIKLVKGVLTVAPCPPVSGVAPVLILGSNSPPSDRSTCTSGGIDCPRCRPPGSRRLLRRCCCRPHGYIQWFRCHSLCLCCQSLSWSHGHFHYCCCRYPNLEQGLKLRRRSEGPATLTTTWPGWALLFVASLTHRKLPGHWLICHCTTLLHLHTSRGLLQGIWNDKTRGWVSDGGSLTIML